LFRRSTTSNANKFWVFKGVRGCLFSGVVVVAPVPGRMSFECQLHDAAEECPKVSKGAGDAL